MAKIIVSESMALKGKVRIGGSKNSVLPLLAASLLARGKCTINEAPHLHDVKVMCDLINALGGEHDYFEENKCLTINSKNLDGITAPYELVNKMRASFLVMGPLLASFGCVRMPLPGGCAIGARPVDLHLKGFAAMGAEISQEHGFITARTVNGLVGERIYLDFPSVGATENIMMAATLAKGTTIIENAATEPEIVDLATFLIAMGADIKAAGTDTIRINGVNQLNGITHTVIPDRVEAGTFMVAVGMTGGDVMLENIIPDHVKPVSAKLKECGVELFEDGTSIRVVGDKRARAIDLKTMPYPGFPTDMQAQMSSLLAVSEGTSIIVETIFENRFMHLNELSRMGASVKIDGRSAIIEGVEKLMGAKVRATDLRAGAGLVIAALRAEGETEISDVEHIDRGYEKFEEKLSIIGAKIRREEQ
jgi:UDP-N-acetylglucosamine 1-carboxyvinyltransferase